jgi:AraC-like DNA-binding protein
MVNEGLRLKPQVSSAAAASKPCRFELSNAGALSPRQKLAGWAAAISVFDVATPEEGGDFDGRFMAYGTNRFVLSRATMPRVQLTRSGATIARSHVPHLMVQLVLAGRLEGTAENRGIEAAPGDTLFVDLQRAVELQSSPDTPTEILSLCFPRLRLQPVLNSDEALHGLTISGQQPAGALIGSCMEVLVAHLPEMCTSEMDMLSGAAVALIARAIVPYMQALKENTAPATFGLNAVRSFIDKNLLSVELGIDVIAANFGLSRASLYRLFEPIGGIASYIRRQRLDRAFQELTAAECSNKRVKVIALRYGFENTSAFTQLFRKTYGFTPLEARKAGSALTRGEILNTEIDNSLGNWLARLHP